MATPPGKVFLSLNPDREARLISAARDATPVKGLTHGFYKYPARFSPVFARAAIEEFTNPGDLVLDPHVGGGTSLVEALAAGRRAIGVDISTLADFVSTVKTTIFSKAELEQLDEWASGVAGSIDIHKHAYRFDEYEALGYYKHLDHPSRWRLRKAIEQGLAAAMRLGSPKLEAFGRCVILRTAQWALDGRRALPTVPEFRCFLRSTAKDMVDGARALQAAVPSASPDVQIILRSAAGLEQDERLQSIVAPRLVLTSPPYPGVHVLYHRWQVDGRKETAAPFWIAGKLDGAGASYYTMGDRKNRELANYFSNIQATMSSVAALADESTVIVQMLAFSNPSWQLERYLATMEEAGLEELLLPSLAHDADGRLWRNVPNRRWYSDQRGSTPGSQEVVLIHRRRRDHPVADSRPSTSTASLRSSRPSDVSASMNGASARQVI